MGNSKYGNRYSSEFKAQVVEHYKTHIGNETMKEFNVSSNSVRKWALDLGFIKGCSNFKSSFKHEACQYYDNHTWHETCGKFGISHDTLCTWRRELGYRNKSRGYNLYMEGLQPLTNKSEYRKLRNDFVMTSLEKDNLKGHVAVLESKLKDVTFMLENLVKEISERDNI